MVPVIIGIVVFACVYLLFNRMFASRYAVATAHTRHALEQIMEETQTGIKSRDVLDETLEILKADINDSAALKFLSFLPFGKRIVVKVVKAGKQHTAGNFILLVVILMVAGFLAVTAFNLHQGFYLLAFLFPLWFGNKILSRAIEKRNRIFVDMFPDVLDMIVRSVRSGFPVNSAISMVAENMEDPVKSEFRQLADELALGRSLNEALNRLCTRIDEQDIRFFVVVLKIQQETGGSLAEIMSNLSNIIRKRKQLRHKIRAMTSEGRATGYILGAIPVVVFAALMFLAPNHLDPLFETFAGNIMFGVVISLIIGAQLIVRRMVDIDI